MHPPLFPNSPTAPTNDTNNSPIIRRVQFPALLNNDHRPTDVRRSSSADDIALLPSNNHTSPMDVSAPFEVDNELTNPLRIGFFTCVYQR